MTKKVSLHTPTASSVWRPLLVAPLLGMVIMVLAACYMYFLSMSVVHVVMQKEYRQDMRSLESEIAALESSYITAQHRVSERIAQAQVLMETNEKIFVKRAAPTLVLSDRALAE